MTTFPSEFDVGRWAFGVFFGLVPRSAIAATTNDSLDRHQPLVDSRDTARGRIVDLMPQQFAAEGSGGARSARPDRRARARVHRIRAHAASTRLARFP